MEISQLVDVAAAEIKERDAFRVIGLGMLCSVEDTSGIPLLWQTFNQRESEILSADGGTAYGVCCNADEAGQFTYIAGVQAKENAIVPSGMDSVSVPSSRYAVFTHSGHVADLPKTVYTIWNKALPDAGLEPKQAPDFELYDSRFNPITGRGDVEIWIPIA